jgi:hypothetical protein
MCFSFSDSAENYYNIGKRAVTGALYMGPVGMAVGM